MCLTDGHAGSLHNCKVLSCGLPARDLHVLICARQSVSTGYIPPFDYWPAPLPQDSKQRLKAMQKSSQPITATAYNHDGTIFAYSVSYDWSRGHTEHNPATAKNYILLHSPSENEVRYSPLWYALL